MTTSDAAAGRRRRILPALRFDLRTVVVAVTVLVLVYLVLGPLVMLVLSSFREVGNLLPFSPGATWSLQNYVDVFLDPSTYGLLASTLIFVVGSLALSFGLSIALAWLTERTDLPLRNLIFVMIVASIGIPSIIMGVAWGLLLNPVNGLLNQPLRAVLGGDTGPLDVFTMPGLIFVQGTTLVPVTYLLVGAAFRSMDVAFEEAATMSGSTFRRVARRITLPLLTPALASALVYQFATVIESFDIPVTVGLRAGIRVLSTQVYLESRPAFGLPDYGIASTYAVLFIAIVVLPLLIYNRTIAKSARYATVTGRSYQPRRLSLGKWKIPAVLFCLSFVTISFLLPAVILVWTSLLPFYIPPSAEALARLSLDAYERVFADRVFHTAFGNTLLLGVSTAIATMFISTVVSWVLVRMRPRFSVAIDFMAFLPHAMPGIIIGLAILLIYLVLPLPIVDTVWVITIALTTQYISIATRLMNSAIAQLKAELEEAGETSGSAWPAVMRHIVVPLVRPAFVNGLLLVFLFSIRNLTMALILLSGGNVMLSTLVFANWQAGRLADTAVVGTVLLAMTVTLSILLRRASRGGSIF